MDFKPFQFADREDYDLEVVARLFGRNQDLQVVKMSNGAKSKASN